MNVSIKILRLIKLKAEKTKAFILKVSRNKDAQSAIFAVSILVGLALLCYFSPLAFGVTVAFLIAVMALVS